jgi:nucleotide-binding universal stress UspA family protein
MEAMTSCARWGVNPVSLTTAQRRLSLCNARFRVQGPQTSPRRETLTFHCHNLQRTGRRPRTGICLTQGMRVMNLIRRLRDEFTALPGLRLTTAQVERLCSADASTSASALHALVSAGFLRPMPGGHYGRTDLMTSAPLDPLVGRRARIMPSPWRRILCLVDLDNESGNGLSRAAHTALRYATTLAVTHRARITALQVISHSSSDPALPSVGDELRKSVFGEPFRGLIDVQVAIGFPTDEVRRVARDIDADLIVIGRGDAEPLSQLSETLRHAPCSVLIVHPSGRAAVA